MMMDAPKMRQTFYCDHCHEPGTTAGGGLWKTAPHERAILYYLHSPCLLPYKARHGLRSVEGRLSLVGSESRKSKVGVTSPASIALA